MKRALFGVLALVLWLGGWQAVLAEDEWVSIKGYPEFADVEQQLQALVNINGFHENNEFCVVAENFGSYANAYVYWPTEDTLIYWEPHQNDMEALAGARLYWNLSQDVLPDHVTILGNADLHKEEETRILENCRKNGEYFKIHKTVSGWQHIENFDIFSDAPAMLTDLANENGHHRSNQFCLVAQKDKSWLAAYVYWPTEGQLILWFPDPDDLYPLVYSLGTLDLKNAVDQDKPFDRFNYRMPRWYVEQILTACRTMGKNFLITSTHSRLGAVRLLDNLAVD